MSARVRVSSLIAIGLASLRFGGTARFQVTVLEVPGATYAEATDINDAGQIVGYASPIDGVYKPVIWDRSGVTIVPIESIDFGYLSQINNQGDYVGVSSTYGAGGFTGLFGSGAHYDRLPTLAFGNDSEAFGLNDLGEAVGYATLDERRHLVSWRQGILEDLGLLEGPYSTGHSINSSRQIVGMFADYKYSHAFLWSNGQLQRLDELGGQSSYAWAINDLGQIVGGADTPGGESHAVLWENGVIKDLGTLPGATRSGAFSINNLGQIVGSTSDVAILWENGIPLDLNQLIPEDSGWNLWAADGINNNGQIIGRGSFNRQSFSYLLTPFDSVPEPSSLAVFFSTSAVFSLRRRPVRK